MAKQPKHTEGVLCRDKPTIVGCTKYVVFYYAGRDGKPLTKDDVFLDSAGQFQAPAAEKCRGWTPREWRNANYNIPMPRPGSKLECFLEL